MENYNHIMLDLETLGNESDAVILSIGAVRFNPGQVESYEEMTAPFMGVPRTFYTTVSIESCLKSGLKPTGSTIQWWMQQSPAAKQGVFKGTKPLAVALDEFASFAQGAKALWGNGATFDNVIIENAWRAAFDTSVKPFPIAYYHHYCFRTLKSIVPKEKLPMIRYGTSHNALDDAVTQAIHCQKLYREIRIGGA